VSTEIVEHREHSALLAVKDVAALLSCSVRHVYRLADAGRMPPPVKLGALVRWQRTSILTWLAENCPSVRRQSKPQS
jgi:excisionase family DNA binding protein